MGTYIDFLVNINNPNNQLQININMNYAYMTWKIFKVAYIAVASSST
jgi:hypothetical protein